MINFDHTYQLWKLRALKLTEWKMSRKFEKEILEKQSQGDEISNIIMQLDEVSDKTAT